MLKQLAGRWLFTENEKDNFVVVDGDGKVTFVDDPASEECALVCDPDGQGEGRFLFQSSEGELLAKVVFSEGSEGMKEMRFEGDDGSVETWYRSAATDGRPRVVTRRRTGGNLSRNWTKEGQEGSPKASSRGKLRDFGQLFEDATKVQTIKARFAESGLSEDRMLDLQQLGTLLKQGREDITDLEILALFREVDRDGAGKVNFDVFVEYLFQPEP